MDGSALLGDKAEALWKEKEKEWERDRDLLEREKRLKDREIAHLTDRSSHYEGLVIGSHLKGWDRVQIKNP